jgi:hypothetical protein
MPRKKNAVINKLFKKLLGPFNILKDKINIKNFINGELDFIKVAPIITYLRFIRARVYPVIVINGKAKAREENKKEEKDK